MNQNEKAKSKIQSCRLVMVKNGQTIALSYPHPKTGWKSKNSWHNQRHSPQLQSQNDSTYMVSCQKYAGMTKKPLIPYSPLAQRSRLRECGAIIPYRNSSNFQLGSRNSHSPQSSFRTTYQANMGKRLVQMPDHQGIVSERTRWNKLRVED